MALFILDPIPMLLLKPHIAARNPSRSLSPRVCTKAETIAYTETNTACSSSVEISSEIVKQGPSSSVKIQSLLSPPSFFALPSHELASASGSRSRSSTVRVGSLSINGYTTFQSIPSSFLPTMLDTVNMMGGDIFTLHAPEATLLLAALDGQPCQGLPASLRVSGFSGFAGQVVALEKIASWPQSKMSFCLPTTGFGLPLRSKDDNCIWYTELLSNYKLPSSSMYNMSNTLSETMPWHYGDLSMEVGSSISSMPNLSIKAMKMKEPMLPLTPPLSQGVDASTNFISFTRPSSNSKPTEFWASLKEVTLPVKQEPINIIATCHDIEFKSINNEEEEPNQYAIPNWIPDNTTGSGLSWSWEAALKHPEWSRNNASSTRITGSTPCHYQSSSMVISDSSSTPKLSQPLPPSSLRAGASSRHRHVTGVIFTNAEKEKIRKDKNLQDLVKTDPKKVKRLVSNRICAAKRKAIKDMHTLELERQVETLQRKCNAKSAELQLLQQQRAALKIEYKEMNMRMHELERQLKLKDDMSEILQAHAEALNLIKFNAVQMGSQRN
ncbi:unnamed protein product [Urochloa humidicola]